MNRLCPTACLSVFLSGNLGLLADVVTEWNNALLNAARASIMNPPVWSRAAAITHLAMYDAGNGIATGHRPYHVSEPAPQAASVEAAISAAAYTTTTALFNNVGMQQSIFSPLHESILKSIPEGQAKAEGIAWGEKVGKALLALRADDGSAGSVSYNPQPAPGVWRPTAPANALALLPGWGKVKPFGVTSGDQFRPHPPPTLSSSAYAIELNVTKSYGSATSTVRSLEQTEVALFWADGAGTETPPGHWNRMAQVASRARNLSLAENARLFALLNMALADAAIVCWDAKYTYNLWRPITAIREADTDGNAATDPDPNWEPLIATPPFPECTSGHSTFSRAAATILASFFGTDSFSFSISSDGLPGVTRSFDSFSQAADEAGISRIYGGIHFPTANISGQACGYALANHILTYFLQPLTTTHFAAITRARGTTRLTIAVEPQVDYLLRASTDLRTWEELATVFSLDGRMQFSDVNAIETELRFYEILKK